MILSNSLFVNNNVVITHPNIFFYVAVTAADSDAFNPNGIRTLLGHGVSKFFINDEPTFINAPKSLPRSLPYCNILDFTRPATPRGEKSAAGGHGPPLFLLAKNKKKGKKEKKESVSKQTLLKGCHRGQNVIIFAILEFLEFKNFCCWSTIVADIIFSVSNSFSNLKSILLALLQILIILYQLAV